jgi:hypothetical protein
VEEVGEHSRVRSAAELSQLVGTADGDRKYLQAPPVIYFLIFLSTCQFFVSLHQSHVSFQQINNTQKAEVSFFYTKDLKRWR